MKLTRMLLGITTVAFACLSAISLPAALQDPVPTVPCEMFVRDVGGLQVDCVDADCPAESLCDLLVWEFNGDTYLTCACDYGHGGAAAPKCWTTIVNWTQIICVENNCSNCTEIPVGPDFMRVCNC